MATHSSVLAWRIPGTGEPGEDRQIDQWNIIEFPEIEPHEYGQLVLDKDAKVIQQGKNNHFNKWCLNDFISILNKTKL